MAHFCFKWMSFCLFLNESFRITTGEPDTYQESSKDCLIEPKINAMALVPYDEASIPLHYKRQREFTFLQHTLVIAQDWSKLGVAAVVWDAAVVLSEYLTHHQELVKGLLVLELGAGTGLVSMVAALAGGQVTCTERAEAMQHLQTAVATNLMSADVDLQTRELDWTHDHPQSDFEYNVILGADIIYIEDTFPDLLRTLLHFAGRNTQVLLSCKIRYKRDSKFLSMMEEHFKVSKIHFDSQRDIYIYSARRNT